MAIRITRHYPISIRVSGWKAIATLVILIAIIAGIITFALSLLVVLAPVLLVGSAAYYFLPKKRRRSVVKKTSDSGIIIDGEYRVVNARTIEATSQKAPVRRES